MAERSMPRLALPFALPAALAAALVLAGCGVKGPLEPPPGAPHPQPQAVVVPPPSTTTLGFHSAASASDMANSATPHASWERNPASSSSVSSSASKEKLLQGVVRPNQPFILDGLL